MSIRQTAESQSQSSRKRRQAEVVSFEDLLAAHQVDREPGKLPPEGVVLIGVDRELQERMRAGFPALADSGPNSDAPKFGIAALGTPNSGATPLGILKPGGPNTDKLSGTAIAPEHSATADITNNGVLSTSGVRFESES